MQVKRFVIELWLINLLINTFTQLMFAGISTRISDDFRFNFYDFLSNSSSSACFKMQTKRLS